MVHIVFDCLVTAKIGPTPLYLRCPHQVPPDSPSVAQSKIHWIRCQNSRRDLEGVQQVEKNPVGLTG